MEDDSGHISAKKFDFSLGLIYKSIGAEICAATSH